MSSEESSNNMPTNNMPTSGSEVLPEVSEPLPESGSDQPPEPQLLHLPTQLLRLPNRDLLCERAQDTSGLETR